MSITTETSRGQQLLRKRCQAAASFLAKAFTFAFLQNTPDFFNDWLTLENHEKSEGVEEASTIQVRDTRGLA